MTGYRGQLHMNFGGQPEITTTFIFLIRTLTVYEISESSLQIQVSKFIHQASLNSTDTLAFGILTLSETMTQRINKPVHGKCETSYLMST